MGTVGSTPTTHPHLSDTTTPDTTTPDTTTNDTSSKKRKRPEDDTNETPNELDPKQKTHAHDDVQTTLETETKLIMVTIHISNPLSKDTHDFTISTPIPDTTIEYHHTEINPFEQMLFRLFPTMKGYTIAISSSIIRLPDDTFFNCPHLIAVTLSDTVEEIGVDAFCRCTNLKTVTFSPVLRIIGAYAFAHSGIECSELPPSVISIGTGAFESCNITHFDFSPSVGYIGADAFKDCHINDVDLPPSLRYVGPDAFTGCKVQNLTLRSNCKIDEMCFGEMSNLTLLTFSHEDYFSQCIHFMGAKNIKTIRVYRSTLHQFNRADQPLLQHLIQLLHAVDARLELIDNTKTTPPQCAICLEVVPLDTMFTECGHVFCVSCCVKAGYLDVSQLHQCPVCKTNSCAKIMIAA
jgi:hypothetical protein